MPTIHAAAALLPQGWCHDVRLCIEGARISSLEIGASAMPADERHAIVLPGMPDLHSHAFQRAMAGLAEQRSSPHEDFWSWRALMYRLASKMTPGQMESVASQLYVELLEGGFTRVGEFHYLHHDLDGRPYTDVAEMAVRIGAAAERAGIALTLLPVFYAHSDFGGAPPGGGQHRFVNSLDGYARLLDAVHAALRPLEGAQVGVAPHSLRAVTPEELGEITTLAADAPIHIHVAEQLREVEDCLAWSGARPVQWLLDHAAIDPRWCLVHATHMTAHEAQRTAASGAVVGLCPITEANLGDGIFDAPAFTARGGRFGIGSDSNVQIGVAGELRALEYSQRLATRARNVLASDSRSTGRAIFDAARAGGTAALGTTDAGLAVAADADLVTLDAQHPALCGRRGDAILDTWIFTGHALVDCVWARGKKLVEGGRHRHRAAIARRFVTAMHELTGT